MASPSTRLYASRNNIDLHQVANSATAEFVSSSNLQPPNRFPSGESLGAGRAEPISRIARLTAENLSLSQQLPTVTHDDAVDTTEAEMLRERVKDKKSATISMLSIHVFALARTLRVYPRFNASLADNGENLWLKDHVHIGIAVDTIHGLMVPVVQNADQMRLSEITDAIDRLATAARDRKLMPGQMQGAGMSISNLGGLGGRGFTPMINPPELAILGIMKTKLEPMWDGEKFVPLPMCPLSLTYDHRVINGAEAQRFLNHYIGLVTSPRRLLY